VTIKIEVECWCCGKPVEIEIQTKKGAMAAMELDAWVECSECHEKNYREAKEYWHTMDFWKKTIKPERFSGTAIDRII
jgi:hypothetical protein